MWRCSSFEVITICKTPFSSRAESQHVLLASAIELTGNTSLDIRYVTGESGVSFVFRSAMGCFCPRVAVVFYVEVLLVVGVSSG